MLWCAGREPVREVSWKLTRGRPMSARWARA
jgi:hypothetical protein